MQFKVFDAMYEEYLSNTNFTEFSKYSKFVEAVQSLSQANVAFGAGIEAVITEAIVSTFDPITKQPMVDPVKGAKCGHTYERSSIIELIKRKPKGTRCPYVGCHEKLTLRDLQDDEQMKLYLSQQRK
ncbi:hypothetical protein QYM36_002664 [Artemia franciscana]|uniref:E3 SUMO-protein ligase NSE2 n=1 Tax=Artemia franciscana TaxID=6661 RepID=A0AA88I3J7_ARTSF|nr:hypothetical protein QYM36_002664 [Artemia franciscana]